MTRAYDPELLESEEGLGGLGSGFWTEEEADLIEGHPRTQPIRRRRRRAVEVVHLGIPGADNRWFPTRREAHLAAWRRVSQLGPDYGVVHDSGPQLGWPHYHVVYLPTRRRVSGHFFYGGRPPRQMFRGRPWREAEGMFEINEEVPASDLQFPRDVIDPRIDVDAQRALISMASSRNISEINDAFTILELVKTGRVLGIYKPDQKVPALMARRYGIGWWQLLETGENSALWCHPDRPDAGPVFVFRKNLSRQLLVQELRRQIAAKKDLLADPNVCSIR